MSSAPVDGLASPSGRPPKPLSDFRLCFRRSKPTATLTFHCLKVRPFSVLAIPLKVNEPYGQSALPILRLKRFNRYGGFLRPMTSLFAFYKGTARTGGLLRAQSRVALNAIRTAVIKAASAYEKDGIVEISDACDPYLSAKIAMLKCLIKHQYTTRDLSSRQRFKRLVDSL